MADGVEGSGRSLLVRKVEESIRKGDPALLLALMRLCYYALKFSIQRPRLTGVGWERQVVQAHQDSNLFWDLWMLRRHALRDTVLLPAFDVDPERAWDSLTEDEQKLKPFIMKAIGKLEVLPGMLLTIVLRRPELSTDRDIIRAIVARDDFVRYEDRTASLVPPKLWDDREVMIEVSKKDPKSLYQASERLLSTPDFVNEAFSAMIATNGEYKTWKAILYNERLRKRIALNLLSNNFPCKKVFNDFPCKKVFNALDSQFDLFFSELDPFHLPRDWEDILDKCNESRQTRSVYPCPIEKRDSHKEMVALVDMDPLYLRFVSAPLAATQEFLEEAVKPAFRKNADEAWEGLSPEQRRQEHFILTALQSQCYFIGFPTVLENQMFDRFYPELVSNRSIVLARVEMPDFATAFSELNRRYVIHNTLCGDPDVVLAVISKIPSSITSVSDELLRTPEFVGKAIEGAGYAVLESETARQTLRRHQHLLVQLLHKRHDDPRNLDALLSTLFDEMASVEWTRQLALAWLTRGPGYFQRSTRHERFDALYRDKQFMIEAIARTKCLTRLWFESTLQKPWDFDMILAAVVSNGDFICEIEKKGGYLISVLHTFAREARVKLEHHERLFAWLLVEHRIEKLGNNETAAALNKQIAELIDAPYGIKLHQIRLAVATLERLGYRHSERDTYDIGLHRARLDFTV